MKFVQLLNEAPKPKPVRFQTGEKLSNTEKKQLLKFVGDVYKDHNLKKELKGIDDRGEEMYGYIYSPEYFLTSDITHAKIRYYIILPDKRIAHPSEVYPNVTKTAIEDEMYKRDQEELSKKEEQQRTLDVANDANSLTDANMIYNKLYGTGGDKYHKNFILFIKGKKHIKLPNLNPWKDRHNFLKKSGFKIAYIMTNGNLEKINQDIVIRGSSPSPNIIKKYFNLDKI